MSSGKWEVNIRATDHPNSGCLWRKSSAHFLSEDRFPQENPTSLLTFTAAIPYYFLFLRIDCSSYRPLQFNCTCQWLTAYTAARQLLNINLKAVHLHGPVDHCTCVKSPCVHYWFWKWHLKGPFPAWIDIQPTCKSQAIHSLNKIKYI